MRVIFHIDINAFFASAEVSRNPDLSGKPLVVCGKSSRSIITTASYEAREFGIHSAMPLFQAQRLCKNLLIRPVDFELYRTLSNKFFELISCYSDLLEVASIDECYVDMTDYINQNKIGPIELAKEIQSAIYNSLNLNVSIGISPNKFLAKMASDMKKPNGITMLTKSNFKELLWPLPIEDMYGVGKKTQPKLIKEGILTIKDIADYKNYDKLRWIAGNHAIILHRLANGIDHSKINISRNQLKSVGNSITLPYDTCDEEVLNKTLYDLSKQVSNRMIQRDLLGSTISITIKYTRFRSVNRQIILNSSVNDFEIIVSTSKSLFEKHYDGSPLRLLGVSVSNIIHVSDYKEQLNLFKPVKDEVIQLSQTDELIDQLNKKLKEKKIFKASSIIKKKKIQNKYSENYE